MKYLKIPAALILIILFPLRLFGEVLSYDLSSAPANHVKPATNGKPIDLPANTLLGGQTIGTGGVSPSGDLTVSGQIGNLEFIDVSKAPYNADLTATTDATTALNNAITDAINTNKRKVRIPGKIKISSTINVTSEVEFIGVPNKSIIIWNGASGGTMMNWTHTLFGGMKDIQLDGNDLAANGLVLTGVQYPTFYNLYVLHITSGDAVKIIGDSVQNSQGFNFFGLYVLAQDKNGNNTNGHSCVYLTSTNVLGNACLGVFSNVSLAFGGTRHGIYVGNADNNTFTKVIENRGTGGTGNGVYVDTTDAPGRGGNVFYHLEASLGGWYQIAGAYSGNQVYGYARDNGEPAPVLNGGKLFYTDWYGNIAGAESVETDTGGFGGFIINQTATGGKKWHLYSTSNGYSQGAGRLLFYDDTTSIYPMSISDTDITATVPIKPVTSDGTTGYSIDATSGNTFTVANNATALVFGATNNFGGLLLITDTTLTGITSAFLVGFGGSVSMLGQSYASATGSFTVTPGTANRSNFYWDGGAGNLKIENKTGVSINYRVLAFRMFPNS